MTLPPSAEHRITQASILRALLISASLAWSPASALADDYEECVAAYNLYNANISTFNALTVGERGDICRTIKPEVGFAACEKFVKSGDGTQAKRDWAAQVSDNLAGVYSKCQAQ